ncbi:MAG: hypothetical protein MJZ37_00170 [Bacilli bacterium]|nr:hypothetical protein [Bacilli bacterium]
MLKKVIIEEDGIRREYEDVLTTSFWIKEDIICFCKDRDIDLENESDIFWSYLSGWMDGCEYYPATSDEVFDCVNEVLKRREEWEI